MLAFGLPIPPGTTVGSSATFSPGTVAALCVPLDPATTPVSDAHPVKTQAVAASNTTGSAKCFIAGF